MAKPGDERSRSTQRFYGLTPEYKLQLHKLIFNFLYASKGSFTYDDVYNMPVYLRNFYVDQLKKALEEEKKAATNPKDTKVTGPSINRGKSSATK